MSVLLARSHDLRDGLWGVDRLEAADVDRVDGSEEAPDLFQTDWEEVNETVQRLLGPLEAFVRQQCPKVRCLAGSTSARAFRLFAYRTFDLPDSPGREGVVVGVNFALAGDGSRVAVRGDIVGEESGHVYYEMPPREIANRRETVLATAQEFAAGLAEHGDVVAGNLG